jgi:cholest-4-en-3-one 26-monooxygenase
MAADAKQHDFHIVHPDHYAAHGYPHHVWTRLRREDPVHRWERSEGIPFWAITRHADIVTISKRPEQFVSGPRLSISHLPEQPMDDFPPTLIQMDPPKHGVYRQLVSKRFTPRALQRIHGDIERIGREIVDALMDDAETGECDFVTGPTAPSARAIRTSSAKARARRRRLARP